MLCEKTLKLDVIFVEAVITYFIWKTLDAIVAYFKPQFPLQLQPYPSSIYSLITLVIAAFTIFVVLSRLVKKYQSQHPYRTWGQANGVPTRKLWKGVLIIIVLLLAAFLFLGTANHQSPPSADLTITVVPQYGWGINTDGTRYTIIPFNKSVTFDLFLNNTGSSKLIMWGEAMTIQYSFPTSFLQGNPVLSSYDYNELLQGKQVDVKLQYGTNLARDVGNSANLVFTIFGDNQSWENSETISVYFQPNQ